MITKINHIGIVVRSIKEAVKLYTEAFKWVEGAQIKGIQEHLERNRSEWFRTKTSQRILETLSGQTFTAKKKE